MPISDTGFIRPDILDIRAGSESVFTSAFPAMTFEPESLQGALVELHVTIFDELYKLTESVYAGYSLSAASGCLLDARGAEFGLYRNADETDEQFRARLLDPDSRLLTSNNIYDGIYARLAGVDGVTAANIFVNNTNAVDADTGLPPHSYEVVVDGGDDDEIAAAIWSQTSGATIVGTTEIAVVDTQGQCRNVRFTRPENVNVCVSVTVRIASSSCGCGTDNTQPIIDAIVNAFADTGECSNNIGDDVHIGTVFAAIHTHIAGLVVEGVKFGIDDGDPNTAQLFALDNVPITHRQNAVINPDCIEINFV